MFCLLWNQGSRCGGSFCFRQPQQNGEKNRERQQKKDESAFVVKAARQKARIHINTEESQSNDSNSVFDERQGERQQDKQELLPRRPQKQVRGEQARNEQSDARADSAALRGHFDRNAGHSEEKPLTKDGDAHSAE